MPGELDKLGSVAEDLFINMGIAAQRIARLEPPPSDESYDGENLNLGRARVTLSAVHRSAGIDGGLSFHFRTAATPKGRARPVTLTLSQVRAAAASLYGAREQTPLIEWNTAQMNAALAVADVLQHRRTQMGMRDDVIAKMQQGRVDLEDVRTPYLVDEPRAQVA